MVVKCDNRRCLKIEETDSLVGDVFVNAIYDTESIKNSIDNALHKNPSGTSEIDQNAIKAKIENLKIEIKNRTESII